MERQISTPNVSKETANEPRETDRSTRTGRSTGIQIAPGVVGTELSGNTFRGFDVAIDVGSGSTLGLDGDEFHDNDIAVQWEDADVDARDITID